MDAKAKVVRWRLRSPKYRADYMSQERDGQYVLFTDHEAALADLAERHAATERNACLMAELANDEKNKRLALLTGLEALAGEWRKRATGCGDAGNYKMEIAYDLAAKELEQFLASAGLEGK